MRKWLILLGLVLATYSLHAFAYTDVDGNYEYQRAIDFITQEGIVGGYPDGSFRPATEINRAEFTKIVVGAGLAYDPAQDPSGYDLYSKQGLAFSDIESGAWYLPYLRRAVEEGIIGGYPDGTFRPAETINLAEAAKIITGALSVPTTEPQGHEWYSTFIEALAGKRYIPDSFTHVGQKVTRGQMAEMVWRVIEAADDEPAVSAEALADPCLPLGDEVPANVDMARVRATWLQWYNDARAAEGRAPLSYNDQLSRSANVWSQEAVRRGEITHQRDPGDAYYDYNKITQWFADLGLVFKNVNRVTHTENIAWEYYNCAVSADDCTDHMIPQVRKAFDFYIGEKGKAYTAHYDSIMQPYFKEVGLGIAVDRSANRYYLTVHYGTEIVSDPLPVCSG